MGAARLVLSCRVEGCGRGTEVENTPSTTGARQGFSDKELLMLHENQYSNYHATY